MSWRALCLRCCVLSLALPAAAAVGGNPRPIVVFWTGQTRSLASMTHVTPMPRQDAGGQTLDDLGQRGIVVLRWRNGKSMAKSATAEDLAAYWQRVPRGDGSGIGIDEFGSGRAAIDRRMAEALRLTHAGSPDLFIVAWHAGLLTPVLAQAYRDAADLVLLESYFSGKDAWKIRMGVNLAAARSFGISGKCLFALGINDADEDVVAGRERPWANSVPELEEQMRWIRLHASETPGFAFFAPRASPVMLAAADRLAAELFRDLRRKTDESR